MKSCLKSPTPPFSPYLSEPPTPGECVRPPLQKTVSFCADEELEEVFEVEDWDRSPLPVTPKLSYEDVLELKQLRLSLPRPAPPPTYRQPFTTSSPTAYTSDASSSSSRPFPYSRFASQPSQTPSKWKNRGTTPPPSANLDPEILPYLDAVPIRLLPLLDTSPEPEPPSPQLLAEAEPITRSDPLSISVSSPQPPPIKPPSPASTQTSPSPPSSQPQAASLSKSASPTTPTTSAAPAQPARRIPTFSFVPLLPVQPTPPPAPEPVRSPPAPQRRINMTFLPLVAPPSPPSVPPPALPDALSRDVTAGSVPSKEISAEPVESDSAATPTLAPIPEPSPSPSVSSIPLPDTNTRAVGLGLEEENGADASQEADADEADPYNDLPARALSPTDLSTPALSSASESDTDEHDGDTDGDEGARPAGHAYPALAEYEYFAARLQSSAGQTPPLSSMYPEVRAALQEGEPGVEEGRGALEMPVAMSVAALKKVKLAALPSPALAPPSPFSLYPPTPESGASPFVPKEAVRVAEGESVGLREEVSALEVEFARFAVEGGEGARERTR